MNKFQFQLKFLIPIFVLAIIFSVTLIFLDYKNQKEINKSQNKEVAKEDENDLINKDTNKGEKLFGFDLIKPIFAEYGEISLSTKAVLPNEKIKFSEISNKEDFKISGTREIKFNSEQQKALEEAGFFLTKNDFIEDQEWGSDDFVDMYDEFDGEPNQYYREEDDSIFISSDLALHLYHILIDRSFQKVEETKFQPMLTEITKALFKDSLDNYNKITDEKLKESYKRLAVYYLVPLVVLNSLDKDESLVLKEEDFETYAQYLEANDALVLKKNNSELKFELSSNNYQEFVLSDEIYKLAKQELELISEAKGISDSPFFTPLRPEFKNDYSQFTPRSHYTKNNILKSYFIAMMWYGRMGFTLNNKDLTRDAIIITGQINNVKINDKSVAQAWSDLASVIEFFVGEVDDLTPYQYTQVMKKVYGENVSLEELTDDNFLDEFIKTAKNDLPTPKIVSEALAVFDDRDKREELLKDTMQFRFMGQRFTPDAYFINNLTQGEGEADSQTGEKLPSMPTALMPISLLQADNKIVKNYLDEWTMENAPNSMKVIDKFYNKLKGEVSAYDEKTWTQNIYWNWLNTYRSLLGEYGEGYPFFMTTTNWQKKNLGTVLGSYTELKHDTLLYAKQSYAEMGAGGEDPELPPVPKGYVEADLVFWNKILALAKMTKNGLETRNAMPEVFGERFDVFIKSSEFFKQIVEKELANEIISDEDFEKLRTISFDLEQIVAPLPGEELAKKDRRAGIIADIHTDAVNSKILYEATGKPYIIYVAVKDVNGNRLTRGAVFNHYEFTDKIDGRLSDEDWQAKVYESNDKNILPKADKWSNELIK